MSQTSACATIAKCGCYLIMFVLLMTGAVPVLAANGAADAGTDAAPLVVYTESTDVASAATAAALLQKARERGHILVDVGLRFFMQPPHRLAPNAAARQAKALRALQDAVAARVIGRTSGSAISRMKIIPYMVLLVDPAQLAVLLGDPAVVSVAEDLVYSPADSDSIPLIHADYVWAQGTMGTGSTVAVLDSGIDENHPQFTGTGKLVAPKCFSSPFAFFSNSLCPPPTSYQAHYCDFTKYPACVHGTHVASIAAGNNSSTPDIGVAPGASIIPVQVFSELVQGFSCGNKPPCAVAQQKDWISALEYVYGLNMTNIAAVNLSFAGTGRFNAQCDSVAPMATAIIAMLRDAGIATIVAAGNNTLFKEINLPACISGAIAVSNTTKGSAPQYLEHLYTDSNYAVTTKLTAPGTDITGAVPTAFMPVGYEPMTGTSQAAPHVTGAFALLKQAKPAASLDDILTALECTGKTVVKQGLAKPRIDLRGAYDYLLNPGVARVWDFSNAQNALDWSPLVGNWLPQGGRYVASPTTLTGPHAGVVISSTAYRDNSLPTLGPTPCMAGSYSVQAVMKRVYPQTGLPGMLFPDAGVAVNAKLNWPKQTFTGYYMAYQYQPPPIDTGLAFITRFDSTTVTTLCSNVDTVNNSGVAVNYNGDNTVTATVQGTSLTMLLNGAQVCQANDATYSSGAVLLVSAFGSAPASVRNSFSVANVTIQPIGSPPVVPPPVVDPKQEAAEFARRLLFPAGSEGAGSEEIQPPPQP